MMETIDKNIALNLKKIRKSQNLSLDMLSERTGVSKSMLGQIERGESNPTVTTIAKICEGLKVGIEDLVYREKDDVMLVKQKQCRVVKQSEGRYLMRVLFPFDKNRNFEVYEIEIEPNQKMQIMPHGLRATEYMMVNQGILMLENNGDVFVLESGDSVCLNANEEYLLHAKEGEQVKLTSVLTVEN